MKLFSVTLASLILSLVLIVYFGGNTVLTAILESQNADAASLFQPIVLNTPYDFTFFPSQNNYFQVSFIPNQSFDRSIDRSK